MRTELRERCELFANNRDMIAKKFMWQSYRMHVVAAAFYALDGKQADIARMKSSHKILKKSANAFSSFRNFLELPMLTKMSLAENPEEYLNSVKAVDKKLEAVKRFRSEYRVLTAMNIYDNRALKSEDEIVNRTKELMDMVKANHPFITSKEDMAMVSMLALTDRNVQSISDDIEACYKILKERFPMHANSVQSLSMVLAASDMDSKQKCDKAVRIFDELKSKGKRCSKGNELALIGMLAILDIDVDTIVNDVADADDYLKTRKGFGAWGIGKAARLMYAAMMVANTYSSGMSGANVAVVNAALTAAIAAAAVIAACAASSASASSAS